MVTMGALLTPLSKVSGHRTEVLLAFRRGWWLILISTVGAWGFNCSQSEEHPPAALGPLLPMEKEQAGLRKLTLSLQYCIALVSIFEIDSIVFSPPVCVGSVVFGHIFSACLTAWLLEWASLYWSWYSVHSCAWKFVIILQQNRTVQYELNAKCLTHLSVLSAVATALSLCIGWYVFLSGKLAIFSLANSTGKASYRCENCKLLLVTLFCKCWHFSTEGHQKGKIKNILSLRIQKSFLFFLKKRKNLIYMSV